MEWTPHSTPSTAPSAELAFGSDPARRVVLDRSATPRESWLGAVALGAQGRYAAARTVLRPLRRTPDPVIRSLAASTEGSLWRQLGWHRLASVHDGRALLEIGGGGSETADARADALIGLAADSIGTERPARGLMLLSRCDELLPHCSWRPRIRFHWVHAEIALAQGRFAPAMDHAEAAASSSRTCPSLRHVVKSDLLVAATHLVAGRTADATREVRSVASRAHTHGLLPLAWASAMLGSALGEEAAIGAGDRYCATIRQRGGVFRSE